jgi:glutathione S-transferase
MTTTSSSAMAEYRICAVVTVLVYMLNSRSGIAVGAARDRFKVPIPKTTGPAEFERVFRAHANNAEQSPQFLALMWVFAFFVNGIVAGGLGVLWVLLRNLYVTRYHTTSENVQMFTIPAYMILSFYAVGIFISVVHSSVIEYL